MKKIPLYLAIFIILLNNIIYANSDVNIGSSDPFWAGQNPSQWSSEIERVSTRCARISLWEVESGKRINVKNICDISYNESKEYLSISNLTKVDIAKNANSLPREIEESINKGCPVSTILYEDQVSLPELIIQHGQSAEDFCNSLKAWFSEESNVMSIYRCFNTTDDYLEKWNRRELCMLIEPMLAIVHTTGILFVKHKTTLYTCAEIGILSKFGCKLNTNGSKNYDESCYKALPFSCFKVEAGFLQAVPPYNPDNYTGFCTTETDFIDMVKSLGCFELAIEESEQQPIATPPIAQHIEQEVVTQKFYTDTYVITSDMVSSSMGFPRQSYTPATNQDLDAKNGCLNGRLAQITFTFTCDEDLEIHNYTQSIAIPQNGQAVSWVRWRTPSKPCLVFLDITTNSEDAVLRTKEMIFEIIDEKTLYPPNAEATDRNDDFDPPDKAYGSWNDGSETENSWATFNYTWHYYWVWGCRRTQDDDGNLTEWGTTEHWDEDYVCDAHTCPDNAENHTCPTGRCHSIQQDWGWVEWTKVIHTATLEVENVELVRSKNSPNTNNSNYSIKSGYGIEANVNTYITNKVDNTNKAINYNNKEITPVQVLETYMPEHEFKKYTIVSKDDSYYPDKTLHFPVNPYSQFEQHCHFTPVWYPDSDYVMGLRIGHCYTPAGELFICINDTKININGNVYDDWHIAPERGKK